MIIKGTPMKRRALAQTQYFRLIMNCVGVRYLQTGPASLVKVLLFENHPLTAMDGAP